MYQSPSPGIAPRIYYASTAIFLFLDFAFDVNVRVAFLDPWPAWRAAYYLACFACLGIVAWRPGLGAPVVAIESLITLSALIIGMGARFAVPGDLSPGAGPAGAVSIEEVINFVIAGTAAWIGWTRGFAAWHRSLHD